KSLLHRDRNPKLHRPADERAIESFRGNADDNVRLPAQHLRFPDDCGIATEALFPHLITDYGYRMSVAAEVLGRFETATQYRADTQCFEVVRRHDAADCAFSSLADAECSAHDLVDDKRIEQLA